MLRRGIRRAARPGSANAQRGQGGRQPPNPRAANAKTLARIQAGRQARERECATRAYARAGACGQTEVNNSSCQFISSGARGQLSPGPGYRQASGANCPSTLCASTDAAGL